MSSEFEALKITSYFAGVFGLLNNWMPYEKVETLQLKMLFPLKLTSISDDILNSSAGPTTEAQLFEDIAKETELKAESDEAAKEKKVAEDASVAPTQLPDATVVVSYS